MNSRKLPSIMTIRQAAQETGLANYLLRKLCITKQIKSTKSGNKYYVNEDSLHEYLTKERITAMKKKLFKERRIKMKILSRKRGKYEDYREIQTKDEAKKFQHEVYGEISGKYVLFHKCLYERNTPQKGCIEYDYKMLIDRINEIIYCAPSIPENIVIYRGISEEALRIIKNSVRESGAYMEKGFMSATLLKEIILEEFPRYKDILKIYVPKGAHALGVDNINDRGEFEILFP